ncbi:MAG TPA: D-alanyl-D-alanine carboxypeptidase/D-alanyl-D-alanine-endopeptidase [Candidatus Angelobacter sp.]|nr:D-alanyl-D-alanine carboxypeptidase/D-alanyl-D-alanine-endopeptidase [Candidatus Angelobacter sp.]
MRSKCSYLLVVVLLCGQMVAAPPSGAAARKKPAKPKLADQINALISQPPYSRAHWGIDAVDLTTGKVLFSSNPDQLFIPASNAKLFTTAAVLAIAGPDYRFHTTIETSGTVDDQGKLHGDLVIVGRGDPNISGRIVPYQLKSERVAPHTQILEQLADMVAAKGVKAVDGDVIGDDTYYSPERYAEGWAQDDLQWIDGAPVTALAFSDNSLFIQIQSGAQPGDKAGITLETPGEYYQFENRIVTTAAGVKAKVGIHREPGSKTVYLWGTLPVGAPVMKEALAIEDPADYTAQLFRGMLERHGIAVSGKARPRHGDIAQFYDQQPQQLPAPGIDNPSAAPSQLTPSGMESPGTPPQQSGRETTQSSTPAQPAPSADVPAATKVLAEHISLPLLEDVRVTNKVSQNLHAEMALRLVAKLSGQTPSFEGGTTALRQFLVSAGLKDDEFVFLDGSGLSRRDLVTPAAVVQLLLYASRQPWGDAYRQSLPVGGVDGSLSERFLNTPAGGLVHAKTGTLSHVNALSGYGETRSGRPFVFSIFCNNHNVPNGKTLGTIDAIVQLLVSEGDTKAARHAKPARAH